jgi:hypothetical protein
MPLILPRERWPSGWPAAATHGCCADAPAELEAIEVRRLRPASERAQQRAGADGAPASEPMTHFF